MENRNKVCFKARLKREEPIPDLVEDAVLRAGAASPIGVLAGGGIGIGQDTHEARPHAPQPVLDVVPHLVCVFQQLLRKDGEARQL